MKSNQFFSGIALVGLAASVTAGSMYVSLSASSQQETPLGAEDVVLGAENPSALEGAAKSVNEPLAPDQVISSRSQDVVLDTSGSFAGRLFSLRSGGVSDPAAEYTVKVIQGGSAVAEAKTDSAGRFAVTGLKPGVAGLLAFSDSGFLLFGVRLIATDEHHPADSEIDMESPVVAGGDLKVALRLISEGLSDGDKRFSSEATSEDELFPIGSGEPSTALAGHEVQLQADGSFIGVINMMDDRTGRLREVLDLRVYLLRDGKVVGTAEVENNGEFIVHGLSPGVHSLVGVGKDGTFAIGLDVVGSAANLAADASTVPQYQPAAILLAAQLNVSPVGAGNFNNGNAGGLTNGNVGGSPGAGGVPGAAGVAGTPAGGATGAAGGGGATGAGAGGGAGAGAGGGALGGLVGAAIGAGVGYAVGQDNNPASAAN
jgi:hypothetical protein